MFETIAIDNVKVGMYLSQIKECEGKLQVKSQGLIKSMGTIESLKRRGVLSIEIDTDKSIHSAARNAAEAKKPAMSKARTSSAMLDFDQHREDLAKADKLYTQAREVQSRFVSQLRSGSSPDFDELNGICQDIIDSVFDNHDALSCLIMLNETSNYFAEHSLNCAILMGIFAKHRECPQADIEDLTLAGLLMDVGMALLPDDLSTREDAYSAADITLMRTHVDIGQEVIERYADLPPLVSEIVLNHHERIDGSGYPKQKSGDEISTYAQMAGIVDCYDAMITERAYKSSKGSQEVLESLLENKAFDTDLVESFIQAVGLYPVGSLVHLKSGKLAIVVQRRKDRPLKPNVMAFYSIRMKHHTEVKLIDLNKSSDKILGAVRPEEFKLNLPHFFRSALLG
ncbi:HD-GYP domain-containing protein [Ningiella sp. W23]|uniref:HD-GYP domain-containing protein n=1 Tax=Ningiella sp. W23 TaxID=3023715 RepID=UPI003756B374